MDRVDLKVKSYEDLVDSIARFESFSVADRMYSADLLIPQLVVRNVDLIDENSVVAAYVVYWGREAARARRWQAQNEAAYRSWRDAQWLALKHTPMKETGKLPTDTHTEKMLHQLPEYGAWRARLDDSQESAEAAEAVHEAFKLKAKTIDVQERLMRDEAGGAYRVSEEPRQTTPRTPQFEG